MPACARTLIRRIAILCSDGMLALFLLLAGTYGGICYLSEYAGVIGYTCNVEPHWFAPSVMLAAGHGFVVVPNPADCPELAAFLNQQHTQLDPAVIPPNIHTVPPEPFLRCHPYLLGVVAAVWRVYGISWDVLKPILAVFFGLTAVTAFALFRLGMNRMFSLVGTVLFVASPGVLVILPSMRDFCKAPFILGSLFLMGYLLKNPMARRGRLGVAALLGLVLGIGLGFRQDVLIGIVPAVLVAACCVRGQPRVSIAGRCVTAAVVLVTFLIPAWPILSTMARTGGTASHYLLQGYSTESEREMALRPASYECVYTNCDPFVHATVNSFDRRMHSGSGLDLSVTLARAAKCGLFASVLNTLVVDPTTAVACAAGGKIADTWERWGMAVGKPPMQFFSQEADRAGKELLGKMIRTFPADLLTRGYGAAMAILTMGIGMPFQGDPVTAQIRAFEFPLARHLEQYAIAYTFAAFLILSCYRVDLACFSLLLLLYFSGYTGLGFQFRHAFHLGFFSLWIIGFLIESVGRFLWRVARERHSPRECRRAIAGAGCRMALACLLAVVVLGVPFYLARAYQFRQVSALLDTYASADLEPVEVARTDDNGWVLFKPVHTLPSLITTPETPRWETPAEYVVAEFEPSVNEREVRIRYGASVGCINFSQSFKVQPTREDDKGPTRFFFPAYEAAAPMDFVPGQSASNDPARWTRSNFLGLAVQEGDAGAFRQFYRVKNVRDFPFFLSMTLPADREAFRYCQTLRLSQSLEESLIASVPLKKPPDAR